MTKKYRKWNTIHEIGFWARLQELRKGIDNLKETILKCFLDYYYYDTINIYFNLCSQESIPASKNL
jgi:hypothetical protein